MSFVVTVLAGPKEGTFARATSKAAQLHGRAGQGKAAPSPGLVVGA